MNIKTIASLAGVSVATVSKIINNYPDISEETRQRVLKIMEETGYRPSSSAKTLATKNPASLVLCLQEAERGFQPPFLRTGYQCV